MVPVVHSADTRSVPELSAEILRLAAAARDRTVAPDDLSGATATVNNVGALGVLASTPMLPSGTTMIAAFSMARPVVSLLDGTPVEVPTHHGVGHLRPPHHRRRRQRPLPRPTQRTHRGRRRADNLTGTSRG